MKKKVINIIAILALVASFILPALVSQNAWADTTLEAFCADKGMYYEGGKCKKNVNKKSECPSGSSFQAQTSSGIDGKGVCSITISPSSNGASSPATTSDSNNSNSNSGSNSTDNSSSATSGSSSANGVTESKPSDMDKTCKGENEVYTSILGGGGCVNVGEGGDAIFNILNTILTILTYGVGIAGTLGIIISGIQYLTARDNEAQLTKAKSRLINIVIGLAAYAMMWTLLQWLIPGGLLSGGGS